MIKSYAAITRYGSGDVSLNEEVEKTINGFQVIKKNEISYYETIFRPSRSDHFTIFILTRGQARFQCNHLKYTLQKNSLFIVAPGVVHQLLDKSDDSQGILLKFTKDFFLSAELHKRHIAAFTFFSRQYDPHLALTDKEADTLVDLMLFLREKDVTGEKHSFRKEIIHHSFNLLMFEIAGFFKKYRENKIIKLTRKEEMLMSFVELLSIHYKQERSVRFYADQMYISPKHLSKTVKEIIGKTSSAVIDEMVITEAKILLDDPDMSIGNVADELNFSDQFYFSKFFKSHTGLNPSAYRKHVDHFQN